MEKGNDIIHKLINDPDHIEETLTEVAKDKGEEAINKILNKFKGGNDNGKKDS